MNRTTNATQTQVKLVVAGKIQNGKVTLKTDPTFAPVTVIDADPALATPFQIGVWDAEDGELCLPELYYVKAQDKYDYAVGYESLRPGTILAEQTMRQFEAEMAEQARLERDESYDGQYGWSY